MSALTWKLFALCSAAALFGCADDSQPTPGNTAEKPPPDTRHLFSATDTSLVATLDRSTLIFDATVLARDTAIGPPSPRRMSVVVHRVFREPAAMNDFAADTAVLISTDSVGLAPGGRAVFFAYGLLAGAKLTAKEVKRIAIPSDSAALVVQAQVAAADSALTDLKIADASSRADAVVLLRVDSLVDIDVPDSLARLGSEHTPHWRIGFGVALKPFRSVDSDLVGHTLPTLFAAGGTELSEKAPQLSPNKKWIVWLHRLSKLPPSLRAGIDTTGRYFILEPEDLRSPGDSARVARAIFDAATGGRGGGPAGPPPSGELQ